MTGKKSDYVWALLRISFGLIFLWAFIDKLFGLGFTTCKTETGTKILCDAAWINGGSPTSGFLQFGTYGPFSSFYKFLAGSVAVDWLFMLGLLLIGLALVLGILIRIASYSGALMLILMWTALLPPKHHPFLDEHIIYAITLIGLTFINSTQVLGFGKNWQKLNIVKKHKFLE